MYSFAQVFLACLALAQPPAPKVAVIIDDIGYQARLGEAAIDLPGPFAVAIMPFAPHSQRLALLAEKSHKDVILHLPMEAKSRNHLLGEGAILASMSAEQMLTRLDSALAYVPQAIGVNNHMGSLLTSQRAPMDIIMAGLAARQGLFFVDSKTSRRSIARAAATAAGVTAVERHVFLDNEPLREEINLQLRELVNRAKKNGYALAIGHPYPATLASLKAWRPTEVGVELVSIREYIEWVSAHSATIGNQRARNAAKIAAAPSPPNNQTLTGKGPSNLDVSTDTPFKTPAPIIRPTPTTAYDSRL